MDTGFQASEVAPLLESVADVLNELVVVSNGDAHSVASLPTAKDATQQEVPVEATCFGCKFKTQ